MKVSRPSQLMIILSGTVVFLTLFSIHFLDAKLALQIKEVVHSTPSLKKAFRSIPNLLPITVFIGTAAMWISYFRFQYKGNPRHNQFLKHAAIAVPIAFLLKMFLQYFFGRTNIHTWLSSGGSLAFNWFIPLSQRPCFPSGHMTVFTSFFATAWIYYPRCRPIAALALTGLASALVLTNYHFLGDVIAGFYCGVLITTIVGSCFSQTANNEIPAEPAEHSLRPHPPAE